MEEAQEQYVLPFKPHLLKTKKDADLEEVATAFDDAVEQIKEQCPNMAFFFVCAVDMDRTISSGASLGANCPFPSMILPDVAKNALWKDLLTADTE